MSFGIMSHSALCRIRPYVVRLCVVRPNVARPNVVRRNVVRPTVGVSTDDIWHTATQQLSIKHCNLDMWLEQHGSGTQ